MEDIPAGDKKVRIQWACPNCGHRQTSEVQAEKFEQTPIPGCPECGLDQMRPEGGEVIG